jgi:hypothetical protein
VPEGGVGADFARRCGLVPMAVSCWARTVPITDRLPAMVAMIANCEIDINFGFLGFFLFRYCISSSGLWHVKLEIWTHNSGKFAHRSSAEGFVGTIDVVEGQIGFGTVRSPKSLPLMATIAITQRLERLRSRCVVRKGRSGVLSFGRLCRRR